jgi:SAM-dependent methyltransferase
MAEHFPLYFPADARRPFGSEEFARRIARVAHLGGGSRVLELVAGPTGFALAREHGCQLTAVDGEDRAVDQLKDRVKSQSVGDRVQVRKVDLARLPFADAEFDGILSVGRVPLPLTVALRTLRRHLAPKGRLVLTYPVKVGRFPAKPSTEYWEKKLGEPLLYPREVLLTVQKAGFEPEEIQSMNDLELDDLYREVEQLLPKQPPTAEAQVKALREEIELHRAQSGKASVSFALMIARRREPGEKPPVSRDSG